MKKLVLITMMSSLFSGCASVAMSDKVESDRAKEFAVPAEGHVGLYVFRKDTVGGAALKKDIRIDGKCLGETAKGVFFFEDLLGNRDVTISTESEFSPNILVLKLESGKNYFVNQYIKLGVFVGGADLKLESEEEGKKQVSMLDMAVKGKCGK